MFSSAGRAATKAARPKIMAMEESCMMADSWLASCVVKCVENWRLSQDPWIRGGWRYLYLDVDLSLTTELVHG